MDSCLIPGKVVRAEFDASHDGLARAVGFLDELCPNPKLSIVFDEIASNVVRCSKATSFCIDVEKVSDGVKMAIADNGIPFDPTKVEDPDLTADVESRTIGGLGIFMVRKMAKSFFYQRIEGRNILTVVV